MAVKTLCGVPGSGKTLNSTRIGVKHYSIENNMLKHFIISFLSKLKIKKFVILNDYYKKFSKNKIINVYSNYPILLDSKNNIYSKYCDIWDLNNECSFEPNSIIILDEIQLRVDSDEYKDKEVNKKLSKIAKFLQAHRHFGIKDIYFITQHPSRLFKKARNVCESFTKQSAIIKIPFTSFAFMKTIDYFTLDDYGKFIPRSREEKKKLPFDYKKKYIFFNYKKVFKRYDSRYLSIYNYNKPLLDSECFDNFKIDYIYLDKIFNND